MHNQEDPVAHRDLKLENILIDGNGTPKITDFSYTRYCKDESKGKNVLSETYCGTEPFLPPGVLVNRPYDPVPADVWSLGLCLFYMLNGKKPFYGEDDAMVRAQRTRNYKYISPYDKKLSPQVKDLISKMLEPNPRKRLSMDEVLQHPWLEEETK